MSCAPPPDDLCIDWRLPISLPITQTLTSTKPCFENDVRPILGPVGLSIIRIDVSRFNAFHRVNSNCLNLPAKGQGVVDGAKILLDIAKESSDWFPPLKSALGGVSALVKHYEVLVEFVAITHN